MKVKAFGIGTEKVEEEVRAIFPTARVARMDRDTTAHKGAHTRIVREFKQGDADVLIGTQMVAKGLDFPNVTLVGVISADTAINMPDFPRCRAHVSTFDAGGGPVRTRADTRRGHHPDVQPGSLRDTGRHPARLPPLLQAGDTLSAGAKVPAVQPLRESDLRRRERAEGRGAGHEPGHRPGTPEPAGRGDHRPVRRAARPPEKPVSLPCRPARARRLSRCPTWCATPSPALAPADRLGLHVDIDPLSMA